MTWRTRTIVVLVLCAGSCALAEALPEYSFNELCRNQSTKLVVETAAIVQLNGSQEACNVSVHFATGLLVTVSSLNLTSSANCSENYLRIATAEHQAVAGPFCGYKADPREATPGLQLSVTNPPHPGYVVLDVNATSPTSNFTLVLTAFTNVSSDGSCPSSKHQCYNKRCIVSSIFCDGHNHCGGTQAPLPQQCPEPVTTEATWWGIGTIIFGVLSLVLLLPCFVWTALRGGQNNVTTLVLPGALRIPSKNGTSAAPDTAAAAATSPTQEAPSVNDGGPSASLDLSVECAPTTSDKARLVTS